VRIWIRALAPMVFAPGGGPTTVALTRTRRQLALLLPSISSLIWSAGPVSWPSSRSTIRFLRSLFSQPGPVPVIGDCPARFDPTRSFVPIPGGYQSGSPVRSYFPTCGGLLVRFPNLVSVPARGDCPARCYPTCPLIRPPVVYQSGFPVQPSA
jgi:hypothetical protein